MLREEDVQFYWELTQLVSETIDVEKVQDFLDERGSKFKINHFETSMDEVLQLYTRDFCYTIIGGSSADKKEWRSNFKVGKLVHGNIHQGFYDGAIEVLHSKKLIRRDKEMFDGHSRGSSIVSVICFLRQEVNGIGFGGAKAFKNHVELENFTNIINPLDPVTWVVPTFEHVGKIYKTKGFLRKAHTGYDGKFGKLKEVK